MTCRYETVEAGMKFNESRYREAVELISRLDDKRTKSEKRRSNRAVIRVNVLIKLDITQLDIAWEKCALRDLSPRGMCVITDHAIEKGSSFAVQFPGQPGKVPPAALICTVIHCIHKRDGTFHVGAEFTGRMGSRGIANAASALEQARISKSILG
jgi:PilZ domain